LIIIFLLKSGFAVEHPIILIISNELSHRSQLLLFPIDINIKTYAN
jgi:hypothetical protein